MPTTAVDRVIEGHPIYHALKFRTDEVIEWSPRRVPRVVKRWYRCEHCPTEIYEVYNVVKWERMTPRRYRYDRGVTIVRVSKDEFLRDQFLATTDLPAAAVRALGRRK